MVSIDDLVSVNCSGSVALIDIIKSGSASPAEAILARDVLEVLDVGSDRLT